MQEIFTPGLYYDEGCHYKRLCYIDNDDNYDPDDNDKWIFGDSRLASAQLTLAVQDVLITKYTFTSISKVFSLSISIAYSLQASYHCGLFGKDAGISG